MSSKLNKLHYKTKFYFRTGPKRDLHFLEDITRSVECMWCQQKAKGYTRTTDGQTDDGQSDPYVALCFASTQKISTGTRVISGCSVATSSLIDDPI